MKKVKYIPLVAGVAIVLAIAFTAYYYNRGLANRPQEFTVCSLREGLSYV